jgi:hypothetical protein
MPYVATDRNRYLGEHSCNQHHYGDQSLIRECCIDDARKYKALTLRNAITDQHPAYRLFLAAWNSLTDAERWQVGDIVPVYDHGPAGFAEREMQGELFL